MDTTRSLLVAAALTLLCGCPQPESPASRQAPPAPPAAAPTPAEAPASPAEARAPAPAPRAASPQTAPAAPPAPGDSAGESLALLEGLGVGIDAVDPKVGRAHAGARRQPRARRPRRRRASEESLARVARASGVEDDASGSPAQGKAPYWPPEKGRPFPDATFFDLSGQPFPLRRLRGKVLLIEPIGISCGACQSFADVNGAGPLPGFHKQSNPPLDPVDVLLKRFAGVDLYDTPGVIHVQLLLFGNSPRRAPTQAEAEAWAEHFRLRGKRNTVVLWGDGRYLKGELFAASYALVPGFWVVDRRFVLRSDGTGHRPQDDPYRVTLALVGDLLRE